MCCTVLPPIHPPAHAPTPISTAAAQYTWPLNAKKMAAAPLAHSDMSSFSALRRLSVSVSSRLRMAMVTIPRPAPK